MINQFKINTLDAFLEYGLIFEKGTNSELLKLPKRKTGLSHSWPESNGTQRYEASPKFETRVLKIPVTLIANSEAEWWIKYNKLRTFLKTVGYFNLDAIALGLRFELLYSEADNYTQVTKIKGATQVGARIQITFLDDQIDPVAIP